ncbi:hypothetical protein [Novosphingobium sp. FSW06-99]|uniref:hypothetical protein n=1 Tax=Novosphingobium sp. FSW06-99 TaxID=1739113 RepID=UPI00076DB95A|nr:hypothetical protein [Novosphingobium sp. FSW06-99]KUR72085.1 hypothetical protein AQZ49_20590 [Novosphingobium sp. FSW06-99]
MLTENAEITAIREAVGGSVPGPWAYPSALANVYPDGPLRFEHLMTTAEALKPSPVLEDR